MSIRSKTIKTGKYGLLGLTLLVNAACASMNEQEPVVSFGAEPLCNLAQAPDSETATICLTKQQEIAQSRAEERRAEMLYRLAAPQMDDPAMIQQMVDEFKTNDNISLLGLLEKYGLDENESTMEAVRVSVLLDPLSAKIMNAQNSVERYDASLDFYDAMLLHVDSFEAGNAVLDIVGIRHGIDVQEAPCSTLGERSTSWYETWARNKLNVEYIRDQDTACHTEWSYDNSMN